MFHRVTRSVVVSAASSTIEYEFSRAIELGNENTAMFEVWLTSSTGGGTLEVALQGSNDLSNWTTATTTTATSAPLYTTVDGIGVQPWAYLRMRYKIESASGYGYVVGAGIHTFKEG